jgi:hypothetical protein
MKLVCQLVSVFVSLVTESGNEEMWILDKLFILGQQGDQSLHPYRKTNPWNIEASDLHKEIVVSSAACYRIWEPKS